MGPVEIIPLGRDGPLAGQGRRMPEGSSSRSGLRAAFHTLAPCPVPEFRAACRAARTDSVSEHRSRHPVFEQSCRGRGDALRLLGKPMESIARWLQTCFMPNKLSSCPSPFARHACEFVEPVRCRSIEAARLALTGG